MANLGGTFDATQVEPNDDFNPIPAGEYRAMIIDSEIKDAKTAGNRYLNLTWKVDGGEYDGRLVWQMLNLWNSNTKAQEIAQRELSSICHAAGKMNVADSEDLHHIPMLIKVAKKTDDYGEKNEVKSVKAADGSSPAKSNGGGQQSAPAQQQSAPANSGGGLPWKKSA